MGIKEETLNELNNWSARQRQAQAATVPGPSLPHALVTAADIDATLVKTSTEELERIVDSAGAVPMVEWRQLTAEQRRALRASNLLARRQRAAQQAHGRQATIAEQQAVIARQQREAQAAAENAPLLEKKRREYERGW